LSRSESLICIVTVASSEVRESSQRICPHLGGQPGCGIQATPVDLTGGVTAVARLCGVTRQSVCSWIEEGRGKRLIDALKLARASGIPIERLAGVAFKPETIPLAKPAVAFEECDEDRE
jgi:hypothetical protein